MRSAPVWRLLASPPTVSRLLPQTLGSRVQMSSRYVVSDDDGDVYDDGRLSDVSVNVAVPKAKKAATTKKSVEQIYQKKTQLEHILLRPDTYIGSVERQTQPMWIYDEKAECMVQRPLSFVPGLFKIFDEILVNAADNKIRDGAMDTLKVDIDKENGSISVFNNGRGIPVEMHKEAGVYVPEMIFGQLLTSSNYDDADKKTTGGRNGYGAKLCNIFSREFVVETADSQQGLSYKQTFSANMSKRGEPKIGKWSKDDYTRITFKPDFAKFGMDGFEEDTELLFKKRVYDMCATVPNVKVFLNGERLKIKNFKQYVELFLKKPTEGETPAAAPLIVYERVNDRWEICATVSDGQFQQVSFVNSINTYKGGTHVDHVSSQIVSGLVEAVKKRGGKGGKDMTASIKPFQVKNHLSVYVNCLIENPTFDSQTKENMTLRASAFGSRAEIGEEFMKKLMKSGVVENILSWARFKQDQQLKKTDGAKRSRLSGIAKLDDANNAGTRNGQKCTLILTEGDSAKALAVSGLSVVGRDNYGVFPLRGKLLNVREASAAQIAGNAEITALKQILGLQQNKNYESTESLRYGHIMIMTDQDHDGSHIKGLLINFLDHFWPSLLRLPGFLQEFITPIVRVTRGRQEIAFYTIPEYEQWKREHEDGRGWTIKYYKGLGTSTAADAKRYFEQMDTHRKSFHPATTDDRQLIDMAFSKKRAEDRKDWLKTCTPETFMDHAASDSLSISDFVNKELILFSQADNVRSIPSMMDGLKPGQRKILFACFKRKLKGEIKVMQLAGYVSEHAAYHHGEQSLCQTIVGLAQNFCGSNNLNLLEPNGQFGTRLQGGKDAASPRYIFTALSPFARAIYRPDDDALLKYLNDDGQSIEPEWYVPIIPMVLVNGCEGIGTGWSTSVPSYNPGDIAHNLIRLMDGSDPLPMHPWYSGFRGTIEPLDGGKYRVTGCWRKIDETTLEISELPVGTWTQSYKEWLESLIAAEASSTTAASSYGIKDYKEHHTDATVRFILHLTPAGMQIAEQEGIEKRFRLASSISTTNLVCFDASNRIKRYSDDGGPLHILRDFYTIRLTYYHRRKEYMTGQMAHEVAVLDGRVRFVREIVEGKLVVQGRGKGEILAELAERGYYAVKDGNLENNGENGGNENETETASVTGYDYLLRMPIYSLTAEKIAQLESDRAAKQLALETLLALSPQDLWRRDLADFLALWDAREDQKNTAITRLAQSKAGIAVKGKSGKAKGKSTVPKKQTFVSDDEFDEDEEEDDEDVYGDAQGTAKRPKTEPKPKAEISVKPEPKAKPVPKLATKPAAKAEPKTRAKAEPKTAKPAPSTTLDAFVTRKNNPPPAPTTTPHVSLIADGEEDEMDLPLAERISRMLARRDAAKNSSSVPAKSKTAAVIISDDED